MFGKKDGVGFERLLDYHKCTLDDYAAFAKPTPESASPLERYMKAAVDENSERGLFCLNWESEDEVTIWGI